ncbi:succinylglutamate desuccinylase [Halomonas llamarensis]|uniref:Succinylglutamate desuccinylase n=1 Tax=Halomonas llamarensis TaxID=2945104 RepID=A0ABT0SPZ6_9GAMM|nr:succinylglutamate desuccinylase [Halomonas llamarensis]MCL7929888.1 succinylglutamate desuccinylase [Halomonas llamarensis]
MLNEWLDWTLEGAPTSHRQGSLSSGHYTLLAPGVLELTPFTYTKNAQACVFSAAIHGNETAPVELVGELLARIEANVLTLGAPVLVILGNLPALRAGQRFMTTNLNRLFERSMSATGHEPARARELMAQVDAFYARHDTLSPLHYDLHTAIRDSCYPRFVVEPYADTDTKPHQWRWLAAADMQAVLHQRGPSDTFSHYSKHYHGAQAFTFELGRVAPFGQNDLASLAPMLELLSALASGQAPAQAPPEQMAFFRVAHEIRRQSEDFQFYFADETPNFTAFSPGTLLAHDGKQGDIRVLEAPLHVVFPNANVDIGARAGLLVTSSAAPHNDNQ